jgi:hypothetical protein
VLAAAAAMYIFLTVNDPDKMPPGVPRLFGWLALCPLAFVLAILPRFPFWPGLLGLIAGVSMGAFFRFALPPIESNIWPIAIVYWSALMVVPIVAGSLAGSLGSRWLRKCRKEDR